MLENHRVVTVSTAVTSIRRGTSQKNPRWESSIFRRFLKSNPR